MKITIRRNVSVESAILDGVTVHFNVLSPVEYETFFATEQNRNNHEIFSAFVTKVDGIEFEEDGEVKAVEAKDIPSIPGIPEAFILEVAREILKHSRLSEESKNA